MPNRLEIYKCKICDNLVEVLDKGVGTLVCCDESMKCLENHIPESCDLHYAKVEFLDELTKKVTLKHPMTQEHHIDFIEVISNDGKYVKRKYLEIDEPCELVFRCECKMGFYVRIYCNIHGVQKTVVNNGN